MSTPTHRQHLEMLTPALLSGASRQQPEWRGASLHGQLHFWVRVLMHDETDRSSVRTKEARLSGGFVVENGRQVPRAAPFAVWIEGALVDGRENWSPIEYPGCPHDRRKGQRYGIAPGLPVELYWQRRASMAWNNADPDANVALESEFNRLLRTWVLLGGIGLRANRAAGSVWIPGWSPTPDQFQQHVQTLRLPPQVQVRLLPTISEHDAQTWINGLHGNAQKHLESAGDNRLTEVLRGIATDTVGGRRDSIPGDPLGYAGDGSERKASPLKLKVGRFSDGFRLIAVHDNRDQRGGRLGDAIDALLSAKKPLGRLLRDATVITTPPTPVQAEAKQPQDSTRIEDVPKLLQGNFNFDAITRCQKRVAEWLQRGRLDLVAEFIRITDGHQYRGMRNQAWYQDAHSALNASHPTSQ